MKFYQKVGAGALALAIVFNPFAQSALPEEPQRQDQELSDHQKKQLAKFREELDEAREEGRHFTLSDKTSPSLIHKAYSEHLLVPVAQYLTRKCTPDDTTVYMQTTFYTTPEERRVLRQNSGGIYDDLYNGEQLSNLWRDVLGGMTFADILRNRPHPILDRRFGKHAPDVMEDLQNRHETELYVNIDYTSFRPVRDNCVWNLKKDI